MQYYRAPANAPRQALPKWSLTSRYLHHSFASLDASWTTLSALQRDGIFLSSRLPWFHLRLWLVTLLLGSGARPCLLVLSSRLCLSYMRTLAQLLSQCLIVSIETSRALESEPQPIYASLCFVLTGTRAIRWVSTCANPEHSS